ncbi:uncharacterized protein LOC116290554 [Actinia tenebrosa]|uniref:Uncharacterized protein LOC116290554 n=1 Tax=Actinia tenebrosa TaxID=6105 RepID=A0A6P8HCV2_ACTTE|nr:uncharacterized protein LOC116290554 [Actinia tenebrosa]
MSCVATFRVIKMDASYPKETIFVQTDLSFNVVLQSLNELEKKGRLRETYGQSASINPIASSKSLFGDRHQDFARTASSVIRMCMLKATGIEDNLWPWLGNKSHEKNKKRCHFDYLFSPNGEHFSLANDRTTAERYWSRYDQLYPHFLIQVELGEEYGSEATINRMMLIFRNNFKEVVEITTKFTVTCERRRNYKSSVHVLCIVRDINQGVDKRFTEIVKTLMNPNFKVNDDRINAYVEQAMNVEGSLSVLFEGLEVAEEEEEEQQQQQQQQQRRR